MNSDQKSDKKIKNEVSILKPQSETLTEKNGLSKLEGSKAKTASMAPKLTGNSSQSKIEGVQKSTSSKNPKIQEAASLIKKDPLAALELLNQIRSQSKTFFSSKLKTELNNVYKESLNQCLQQSRNKIASALSSITKEELLTNERYAGKPNYSEKCPNLAKYIKISTDITNSVGDKILSKSNPKERAHIMEMYLHMAELADKQGDSYTATSIVAAFFSAHVSRLNKTHEALPGKTRELLAKLKEKYKVRSMDESNKERERMVSSPPTNAYHLPFIPSIGPTFLTPLLMASQKQDQPKYGLKTMGWSNDFIDKADKGSSLDEEVEILDEKIKELESQIKKDKQENKLESSLLYKLQDLEAERNEAKKVQGLGGDKVKLTELKDKNNLQIEKNNKVIKKYETELETLPNQFMQLIAPLKSTSYQKEESKDWYAFTPPNVENPKRQALNLAMDTHYFNLSLEREPPPKKN